MMGRIAISVGDVTGIGPEVTLKALAAELEKDDAQYLLIGDGPRLQRLHAELKLNFSLELNTPINSASRVCLHHPLADALPAELDPGSPAAARAAIAWLNDGAHRCLRMETAALVTAPVNKEAILRSGQPFIGQTEFLSELAGTTQTAMMLLGYDDQGRWLRVALATTHLPLKLVATQLRGEKIALAISLAAKACQDLGLARARIGVCALNPHAGEGGELGTEENTLITPVVDAAREKGFDVIGPLAADALFYHAYRGDYDAVIAMYHDQGLIPLKMVAFENGVNWTLGLPFVRTSPDHGTAYDIAGKGIADPSSMIAAIQLAKKLAART
ncbi:MAG: 4-hydroxythreonine-4-phosphate dehydrogenase PdxA [Verrucomicrobiota bacterium]